MRLKKPSFKKKAQEDPGNPWTQPEAPRHETEDQHESFNGYLKDKYHGLEDWSQKDVGWFGVQKIHVRFLRHVERLTGAILFFFYLGLAIVSIPNPLSMMFAVTSYLLLRYEWKSRKAEWKKQKE